MTKLGTIQFWNDAKRFGIITSKNADNSVDRYYLQYSRIIAGKEIPSVGDTVRFATRLTAVLPGKLPLAYEVEILTPEKTNAVKEGGQGGVL